MTSIIGEPSARRRGFTLVEILTVIIIIGIIASLTIGASVIIRQQAKEKATLSILQRTALAIEAFRADHNELPPDNEAGSYFAGVPAPVKGSAALVFALGKGRWVCANCGESYSRAFRGGTPFQAASIPHAHPKDRFAPAKDYLSEVSWDHIGRGVVPVDLDQDPATAKTKLDLTGCLLDAWGQPIFYDNLTTDDDGYTSVTPPADKQYVIEEANGYILFSLGPD